MSTDNTILAAPADTGSTEALATAFLELLSQGKAELEMSIQRDQERALEYLDMADVYLRAKQLEYAIGAWLKDPATKAAAMDSLAGRLAGATSGVLYGHKVTFTGGKPVTRWQYTGAVDAMRNRHAEERSALEDQLKRLTEQQNREIEALEAGERASGAATMSEEFTTYNVSITLAK